MKEVQEMLRCLLVHLKLWPHSEMQGIWIVQLPAVTSLQPANQIRFTSILFVLVYDLSSPALIINDDPRCLPSTLVASNKHIWCMHARSSISARTFFIFLLFSLLTMAEEPKVSWCIIKNWLSTSFMGCQMFAFAHRLYFSSRKNEKAFAWIINW